MSRRTFARLGIVCTALLVPLTACSSEHPRAKRPSQPTRTSQPPTTVLPTPSTAEPGVQHPPELDPDETLAGRQTVTSGNATLPFNKGRKGDALIVAVRCQGQGTIKVAVRPVHVSFPLECVAGKVSTTYNQVAVGGANHSGVVSVEAPTAVRWSMTIGRGLPAEEDPPTIEESH
ncbi:hypothetical protein AB0F03_37020 [Streptomyces sp. NPDC028722]|uniref:hypothetical protein n=1 Tax=Streptomyces sp. NPDC028722 TaxID=3155016 RepID=UPI0033E0B42F